MAVIKELHVDPKSEKKSSYCFLFFCFNQHDGAKSLADSCFQCKVKWNFRLLKSSLGDGQIRVKTLKHLIFYVVP